MTFVSLGSLVPQIEVAVDATTDPTSATRTWTDITTLVRGLTFTRSGRDMELNRSSAGSLSAVCDDTDGAITGLGLRKRQWVRVRAKWNGVTYARWQGVLESLPRSWWGQGADQAVEFRAADIFKVLGLLNIVGATFSAERNDQRVVSTLALFARNGALPIDTGSIDTDTDDADAVTSPMTGVSALDYLLQIEESENGLLIANPDGTLDFQGRHWRAVNSATSEGTFGEAATEIPYFDDVELDDDDSLIANVVNVTPFGGTAPVTVENGESERRYWPSSLDRQLLSSSVPLATSAAEYLSQRYGDPSPRIPAIRVDLGAVAKQTGGTSLSAALLAANNSDRFTWKRAASTAIDEDVYIEQIAETIDPRGGSWEMAFKLSPASDEAQWLLEDPVFGLLEETTRVGY